jgi:hypothetical protein
VFRNEDFLSFKFNIGGWILVLGWVRRAIGVEKGNVEDCVDVKGRREIELNGHR